MSLHRFDVVLTFLKWQHLQPDHRRRRRSRLSEKRFKFQNAKFAVMHKFDSHVRTLIKVPRLEQILCITK